MEKMRLGISSCILGNQVRYNGGHTLDRYIRDTLGKYVDFVPVCPEVECGMPIPREALRLVGAPETPRLVTIESNIDYTNQMQEWGQKRLLQLESEGLSGYIFKSKSPSSGMERIKVYNEKGVPRKEGVGIWARMFMEHFPLLPIEDEGRLHDPGLRENFIERIFVFRRWRSMMGTRPAMGQLVRFHTVHKLLVMSHSQAAYRELGRLVAGGNSTENDEEISDKKADVFAQYLEVLVPALKILASRKNHRNVLFHLKGYFKEQLTADEKAELDEIINEFAQGNLPLLVPITLINHYVRKYREPYLAEQVYLHPHPLELKLRTFIPD